MAQYQTVGRITLDRKTVIEPGKNVELNDEQAQSFLSRGFIKTIPQPTPIVQPAPTPSVQQLQTEVSTLEQQVSSMEHEGGTPS